MPIQVTHAFVSGIADSSNPALVNPSNWNALHTVIGGSSGSPVASDYNFTSINPSGSLTIGANTVTLPNVPVGVNGTDTAHYLYITGPGAPVSYTVSGATNADPVVLTLNTTVGLVTGNFVVVSGIIGCPTANGAWVITVIDGFHISLNNSVALNSVAYVSGGTVSFGPEAVLITGGTAVSGGVNQTLTFACKNPHAAGYSLQSATAGASESIVYALANGFRSIQFLSASYTINAPITFPESNFSIQGVPQATILTLYPGLYGCAMFLAAGSQGVQTTSTTQLTELTKAVPISAVSSLNVASSTGFAIGNFVQLAYPGKNLTITGATNASPIVLSFSTPHGMVTGDFIDNSNVLGNTTANGGFYVTYVDATHVSLNNSAGDGAYISGGTAATNGYAQTAVVLSTGAGVLNFQDDICIPIRTTDINNVSLINMLTHLNLQGLILDGGALGDATFDVMGSPFFGVNWSFVSMSTIRQVEFRNWTQGAGFYSGSGGTYGSAGYGNKFSQILLVNSGSSGWNDFSCYFQTDAQLSDISSHNAYGFASGMFFCVNCQVSNYRAMSPRDRGFKFDASCFCTGININCSNSKEGNGLAIAGGSYSNILSNIIARNNPSDEGIWFSGQGNEYNIINGAYLIGNGIHDLFFNQGDAFNIAINIFGGVGIADIGDGGGVGSSNTIRVAAPLRSLAYYSTVQSIPNNTLTALTFDTNYGIPGGSVVDFSGTNGLSVHSTVTNPTRFTVTPGQSNAGGFAFGLFQCTAHVTFATNATGYRLLKVVKNDANVLGQVTTVPSGTNDSLSISVTCQLSLGDYIEFYVLQSSGGALNTVAGLGSTDGALVKIY
jgi:hypothetical protein